MRTNTSLIGFVWPIAVPILVVLAVALRSIGLDRRALWLDELLSVNFAQGGLFETLITTLRFDVHMPLYYLQLNAWMNLGVSDAIVAANSIAWSVVALSAIIHVTARLGGPLAGVIAGALFAVAPIAVAYGPEVRMYAMAMALLVLAFAGWIRWLESAARGDLLLAIGACLAVVYSHGVGLIMIVGICAYVAFAVLSRRRRADAVALILGLVAIDILSLPAFALTAGRGVQHIPDPGTVEVLRTLHAVLFGYDNPLATLPTLAAAVALAMLAAACLWSRRARLVFATTVALPLLAFFVISHVASPIWLTRVVVTVAPFLAISLGLALADLAELRLVGRARAIAGASVVAIALAGASVEQQRNYRPRDPYAALAAELRAQMRPGDAIHVGLGPYGTWALLWYLAGPRWGGPLSYHEITPAWRALRDRLDEGWVETLRLRPTREAIDIDGVRLTAEFARPVAVIDAPRLIVLSQGGNPPPPSRILTQVVTMRPFTVETWERR